MTPKQKFEAERDAAAEDKLWICHPAGMLMTTRETWPEAFKLGANWALTYALNMPEILAMREALAAAIKQMHFSDNLDLNDTNRPTIENFCAPAAAAFDELKGEIK